LDIQEFDNADNPPFSVFLPLSQSVPFVFNSPHSGRTYPPSFLATTRLDTTDIRQSEDFFVEQLFSHAVECGAPLVAAHFPRAFLDVNREPYELDPRMFEGKLPPFANIRSARVAGGLGTIARIVSDAKEIYARPLAIAEALERVDHYYRPYHDALRRVLAQTHVAFGHSILIDCHSMPSCIKSRGAKGRPDIIIGDRYGTSCSPDLSRYVLSIFRDLGYAVARNKPYAGGFITEHYGRPARGLHAIQIELNRGLYMNETTLQPNGGFPLLVADINTFIRRLVALRGPSFQGLPMAAE
jgi:N-formylglutamate amidohydrolase